jgi:hypothetical protein
MQASAPPTFTGAMLDRAAAVQRHIDRTQPVLLGIEAGTPLFAVDVDGLEEDARKELTAGGRLVSLREAGAAPREAGGGTRRLTGRAPELAPPPRFLRELRRIHVDR